MKLNVSVSFARRKRCWKGVQGPSEVVNLRPGRVERGTARADGGTERDRISQWLAFYRILTLSHVNILPFQENKL